MNQRHCLLYILLLILFFSIATVDLLQAQSQFKYTARSVVHSFGKKDYNAANQNWSISQSPDGYMYFGNTSGLLEYNGKEWTLYELPDKLIIRSVYADKDKRIYTGAHEEFGYWEINEYGKLHYKSLVPLLPKTFSFSNEDIWSIRRIGAKVYFQSFSKLYTYDGVSVKASLYDKPIFSLMELNGTPYISLIGGGLYQIGLKNNLVKIPSVPDNLTINNLLRIGKDTTLILTEMNGMFLWVKNQFAGEWRCTANSILKDAHINRSALLNGNQLIIGTINNGIFLVNRKGAIIRNWNFHNGLQNNTILSIYIDRAQNLWAGLDKGIDYLNLRSPYQLFLEDNSSIGSVYCAALSHQKLYVGTNHGLFVTGWPPRGESVFFKPFQKLKGQVWNIQKVDNVVVCGSNAGTFTIDDEKATQVSTINGGTQLAQPLDNNRLLYQGTYTGVSIYRKGVDGTWHFQKALANFWSPVRTLQLDHENTLWVGDLYKGLYRIWFSEKLDSAIKVEKFGKRDGFPSDYNIQVYKVGNSIVFTSRDRIFTYDYINHKITPFTSLNANINGYSSSHSIFRTDRNEYWFARSNSIQQFHKNGEKLKPGFQINLRTLGISAVDGYENIWKLDQSSYILGLDNGFLVYSTQNGDNIPGSSYNPRVYKVETFSNNGEMRPATIGKEKNSISYSRRNVIFYITTPGEIEGACSYLYRFDNAKGWNEAKEAVIATNSLSAGAHTLHIKSINRGTNREAYAEYTFRIMSPWYSHPIALILYLLAAIACYRLIKHINIQRHRKQKYEYLKKMKELKRIQLENLQKEHLMHQVESKANELANYTMLIRTKNDVLNKIKSILDDQSGSEIAPFSRVRKSILSLIDKNLSNKNEWEQFQNFFDEANKAFTSRLKKRHPDLTPNDLRFCSFLRMNMNSKEISLLLNISERSIEVKRYRLRKRMNMEHDKNLIEYMMDI